MIIELIIGSADGPTSIFLSGIIGDFFMIPAYTILIIFYGIYITKQFIQKKHGIHTIQLGKRKERNIWITEILLSTASVLIILVQLISITNNWNIMPTTVRAIGTLFGFSGDLIFLIAVITMKNSWRAGIPAKSETKLVSNGIYRYSRNPVFLGFDLMYIGILLMYFNILSFIFTCCTIMIFHLQILQEEVYLESAFGSNYLEYKNSTRRYIGKK